MQLGAASVLIPRPVGQQLAGYSARTAPSTGVHQPLRVRALVASTDDGTPALCLLSLDTLCVDAEFTASLRAAIVQRYPLAPSSIMVTATHTHAAPAGTARFVALGGAEAFLGPFDQLAVHLLHASCLEAVEQATDHLKPAQLKTGVGQAEGVGRNRRDPAGPYDPAVPFLLATDEFGTPIALVYSYACHPTVLDSHNTLYSGDLAGVACAQLEAALSCVVLPLTGAAGDISTRFTRRASDIAELERLATLLADSLAVPSSDDDHDTLASAIVRLSLPLKPAPDRQTVARSLADAQDRLLQTSGPERRVVEAQVEGLQVALEAGPRSAHLATEVQALRLGRSLVVGFPGEMFVDYGLALRQRLSPAPVLIAGYANDYVGYVPTPGTTVGYEADSAVVTNAAGGLLLNAAEAAAQQCLAILP